MNTATSKYLCVGPGGRKCNCCFPAPGSKDRRAQFRSAKRKADRAAMKEAYEEIADAEELRRELERLNEEYIEFQKWNDDEYSMQADYDDYDEPDYYYNDYDDYDEPDYYYNDYDDYETCWHCGSMACYCQCDGNGPA